MSAGLALGAALLAEAASGTLAQVAYRVQIGPGPRLRVELRPTPSAAACPLTLVMPRAVPMGYGEQPYDRFLEGLQAIGPAGESLEARRRAGPRWELGRAGQRLDHVAYEVDLVRLEDAVLAASDASRWREGYLSLLGYSVFAFLEGREEQPVRLEVSAPPEWPIFTTLAPRAPASRGRVAVEAAHYYALADAQLVAGPRAELRRVHVAGPAPPLFLSLYSEAAGADADLLGRMAAEAYAALIAYFGAAPFPHYTVVQEYLGPRSEAHRYGFSMEHLESATFALAADEVLTAEADAGRRARVLFNLAHHMAHAWIPKRSYGEGYYPFSWELAPVLDSVWFSEGFGQFAAIDALAATKPAPAGPAYREGMLARRFGEALAEAPPFLRRMPLVQLSRVASTRYAEDFRTGRTVFARGGLMAAEIDEAIRRGTGGAKGLRDALRELVAWSAREQRPFRIDELPDRFREATGVDVRGIYERGLGPR